jgi:hypothetical protein
MLQRISRRWSEPVIVAASGCSLTSEQAHAIGRARAAGKIRVIAVNDAVYPLWFADAVYASDESWWQEHRGLPGFRGEKWSSHGTLSHNNKLAARDAHGLNLIRGVDGDGFCFDPAVIHYGDNSGFQAINLAGHFIGWEGLIALVAFDMRIVDGRRHFFGEHPPTLRSTISGYEKWPRRFAKAAEMLPCGIRIWNATASSALTCFPHLPLADVINGARR